MQYILILISTIVHRNIASSVSGRIFIFELTKTFYIPGYANRYAVFYASIEVEGIVWRGLAIFFGTKHMQVFSCEFSLLLLCHLVLLECMHIIEVFRMR